MVALNKIARHQTHKVMVGNVAIGNGEPVVVQSMTNTDTADIEATVQQVLNLHQAGSQIVRLTVNNEEAAQAVPYIKEKLLALDCNVPLVGCFHYNGHTLLNQYEALCVALDKYRINPGNVGFGEKRDRQFEMMIEAALKYNKPVRIGVNWGSLDQALAAKLMDDNAKLANPASADEVMREALIASALQSAQHAEQLGLTNDKIIISAKVSRIPDLVAVYQELARRSNYCLHLGLTEAGIGSKGIVATAAALGILLTQGIGDTIRASLTPMSGASRDGEVIVCQELLQTLGLRYFSPLVISCPGCGRTTSTYFQHLAAQIQDFVRFQMPTWRKNYPGVESLNIAVMGCIVNGPGESKHADIGISLPGTGENPVAPVFIDGRKTHTLRGDNIITEFQEILHNYIIMRFGNADKAA